MSRNRAKYSQSVSLRKVAHQVLTSEECLTFKEALKVFRETKTTEQLVNDIGAILDSPKKLNLLREIVLLLPESQRPEFIVRCRSQLKGADLLLQESFIAAEFEQRFGQKMASLILAPMEATSSGSGASGRRMSMSAHPTTGFPGTEAACLATNRSSDSKITLSESAPIRKLNDDKAAASLIKLRSATFQVRYRTKLPIQFDSLPEETSTVAGTSQAARHGMRSSNSDEDSSNTDEEIERERQAAGAGLRAPLSDLRDKGFWALNSPRRALEERRKLQQQRRRQRENGGDNSQDVAQIDSDSPPMDLASLESRRRQRYPAGAAAAAVITVSGRTGESAVIPKTPAAGAKSLTKATDPIETDTNESLTAYSPVPELRSLAPHSPSDSQIYKLLYAPSSRAAEDQMSLTSSTLEGDFLKARHLRNQMAEPTKEFDTPHAKFATFDKEIQCNLNGEAESHNFVPSFSTAEQQSTPPQPPFGFYFVPMMAPYLGSHLIHHNHHSSAGIPVTCSAGGSYFPWSQFWSTMPQPPKQQQPHQPHLQFITQGADIGRLRRVTLRKVSGDSYASFGISVSRLAPEYAAAVTGRHHLSPFVVSSVETGSPAHCQGIQPGDQIVELEGEPVSNMSLNQLGLAVRSLDCIHLCLLSKAQPYLGANGTVKESTTDVSSFD